MILEEKTKTWLYALEKKVSCVCSEISIRMLVKLFWNVRLNLRMNWRKRKIFGCLEIGLAEWPLKLDNWT